VSYNSISRTAFGLSQFTINPSDLSSNANDFIIPNNVAEVTPGCCDRTANVLTAARLNFHSLPHAPKMWGQINQNCSHYHSDRIEISRIFWIHNITIRWHMQEETQSKCANLANVTCDISFCIPYGVRAEATVTLRHDLI
jgi:hypothetical protein